MSGAIVRPVPTRETWRDVVRVISSPDHLKRTLTIAVVVGTAFFAMNQLGLVLAGRATAMVWCKSVLTYLTPFCVSNIGIVSASRHPDAGSKEHFDQKTGLV